MKNKTMTLALLIFLMFLSGCRFTTTGEGRLEICLGIHTQQISDGPAVVEVESSIVDKIIDNESSSDKIISIIKTIVLITSQFL